MRKQCVMAMVGALAALSLIAAPGASAATEIGSNCAATGGVTNYTLVQLSQVSPLPVAVPSAGVITSWKVNSELPLTLTQRLKILRPTGKKNEFTTITETAEISTVKGKNTFSASIPVQAGDRIAGYSTGATGAALYCTTASASDVMGSFNINPAPVGSINTYTENLGLQLALAAVIEPDADKDGFGDETQDKCPQLATVQAVPCPLILLDAIPLAKRGSVTVLVTTNNSTSVTVSGAVKVAGKAKKTASSSALLKLKGVTAAVNPGSIASISLAFPAKLKSALKALPPKRSLSLTVTASATNPAGQVSTDTATVKLKGQARSGKRPKR
jgi:hypothetical protein